MNEGKLLRSQEPTQLITGLLTSLAADKTILDKMIDDQADMCSGATISLCHDSRNNFVYHLACIQLYMMHMVNLGLVCFINNM